VSEILKTDTLRGSKFKSNCQNICLWIEKFDLVKRKDLLNKYDFTKGVTERRFLYDMYAGTYQRDEV
jgi:hypothetical protein